MNITNDDSLGFTDLTTGELCETTQQQLNDLLEQEEHLAHASEDLAITDIKTIEGLPVQLRDIQPHTVVTVNGISGQVDHLIEAGILSKSIYAGNYDDYLNDAEDCFEVTEEPEGTQGTQGTPEYISTEALSTATQIEDAIGSANTIDTLTNVLSGVELSTDVLAELSESYGVSPEQAEREVRQATTQLYEDFTQYAENELGITDVEHLSEWVAYAVNQDIKIKQLYQQAVTGALNGDFTLSQDLVQGYKRYYVVV
jgi:hypothetical protein